MRPIDKRENQSSILFVILFFLLVARSECSSCEKHGGLMMIVFFSFAVSLARSVFSWQLQGSLYKIVIGKQ